MPFSVGLDALEDKLRASGIRAQTRPFEQEDQAYREILRRNQSEVALIGHSMGAKTAMRLTERLAAKGIRVAFLGLIDIPGMGAVAPANASWAENYYSGQPGFGRLGHRGSHQNLVLNTRVRRVSHVSIDDSERVHDALISAIWLAEAAIDGAARTSTAFASEPASGNGGLDLIATGSTR